jgi:lysophospholipase L1-like esterase
MRLVCVGDSFTEGVADDLRADGEYGGWSDRVAQALARTQPVEYANLAVRGKLLDQVVDVQVPAAEALHPNVLTFHAGGNDVLRRGTDLPDLYRRYHDAVAALSSPDRRLVIFTCLTRAGGTGRLADTIAYRIEAFNDTVRDAAERNGATLVDIATADAFDDRRLWNVDRLHLNAEGHKRVAAAVLETLGLPIDVAWREPLPAVKARGRAQDLVADVKWAGNHFAPWVWRRVRGVSSGDGRVAKQPQLRQVKALSRTELVDEPGGKPAANQ